jgi:hypothetical protein
VTWVGHVAHMWRWEMLTKFWLENLERRYHLEDVGIYGRVILKYILRR